MSSVSSPIPITATVLTVPFQPTQKAWGIDRSEPVPTILVKTPTARERDQLGSRLIRLGLMSVSQEVIRATLVEELFEVDWGKGDESANEAEADELARFIDSIWIRSEAHNQAMERWQESEVQRLLDEQEGVRTEPKPAPVTNISLRENAKSTMLVNRMMTERPRLRDLAARNADFERQQGLLIIRLHVVEADLDLPLQWDKREGVMTDESAEMLREALPDEAWRELMIFCRNMATLGRVEEKNSDSPLEQQIPSGEDSSTRLSSNEESKVGSSTASNIDRIPEGGSETITAPSSGSGTRRGRARANSEGKPSLMAGA